MLCEKCGTENKEGTSYCKHCGEDLVEETKEEVVAEETAEETEETVETTEEPSEEKDVERTRTSPLAVRMHEKDIKEDKKLKNKIKRGKVWAAIAVILAVLFVAENATLILINKGIINSEQEEVEAPVIEEVEEPLILPLGSEALSGDWTYSYSLTKYWDSDESGNYSEVTETITSEGIAGLVNKGDNHMAAVIIPGTMVVDGNEETIGNTPEAFSAWYAEDCICIQMKGTEQKFFAPGGAEPLVIKIPVSMDEAGVISGGTYEHTYEKVVTEMNMRYVIRVTLEKN